MQPCIKCEKVPQDGWYSKSGYCKECAEEVLRERKQAAPPTKKYWLIAGAIAVVGVLVFVATKLPKQAAPVNTESAPIVTGDEGIYAVVDQFQYAAEDMEDISATVSYNAADNEFIISISQEGLTSALLLDAAKGRSGLKDWAAYGEAYISLCESAMDSLADEGVKGIDSVVRLSDAADPGIMLLVVRNGEIEYDIVKETPTIDLLAGEVAEVSGDGKGDTVITTTAASDHRLCKINFTHDGERNFIIHEVGATFDYLINEIGPWDGWYLFTPGEHSYEITADGNWTYEVSAIKKGARTGASGNCDGVSDWFDSVESATVFFSHSGDGNFIVHLLCVDTGEEEYIVNEVGGYHGQKYVKFDPSLRYVWIVIADGGWTIEIK